MRLGSDHGTFGIMGVSALGQGAQMSSGLFGVGTQVLTDEEIA